MRKIKFILAACTAIAAFSCAKEADLRPGSDGNRSRIVLRTSSDAASAEGTKADAVTTSTLVTSGFKVSGTSGATGSETEVFTNVAFSCTDGENYTGEAFWAGEEPAGGYHFYASNVNMTYAATGATVNASNATDVVCAYLPSPTYLGTNSLSFEHVFTRLFRVNVLEDPNFDISNVSIRITPKTGGVFDIRSGYGHNDGTGWSSLVTGTETVVANQVGENTPDLYMVPGRYEVKVSWTATMGSSSEEFTDETVEFDFGGGNKNVLEFTLGGSAVEMKFVASVVPWAETYLTEANEGLNLDQPLTFEIVGDGTIVWKTTTNSSSYDTPIYYRKNCGDWTEIIATYSGSTLNVNAGDILEFYGENDSFSQIGGYYSFAGTAPFIAYGNVQSLLNYSLEVGSQLSALFRNSLIQSRSDKKLILGAKRLVGASNYTSMFSNCTNLVDPPVILAENLTDYCFSSMFNNCTNLIAAPDLSVDILTQECYRSMFYNCRNLVKAPEKLPAAILTLRCYQDMFGSCSSLAVAPELPATTLATQCYQRMFSNCSSLTVAPELPATTLTVNCYESMFQNCTSLAISPELPATTLAEKCYYYMFVGCSNLVSVPSVLPADTMCRDCYARMFYQCSSLLSSPQLPALNLDRACYNEMFYGCSSLVTAPELPATNLAMSCYQGMFNKCTSLTTAPELPSETLAEYCYSDMFRQCSSLVTAPELPALTLTRNCYTSMFRDCSSLVDAPELPATTLALGCYSRMFYGCTNLVNGPSALPATSYPGSNGGTYTGENGACYYMFYSCSKLSHYPAMTVSEVQNYALYYMFYGCTAVTGTPPVLSAETLAPYCYCGMFYYNTKLAVAPELPATSLAESCYASMFNNCTSLIEAPDLPATSLANSCYSDMFNYCTSLTVAPDLPSTSLADFCYDRMFAYCPNLTVSPELPATTLAPYCYREMFSRCSNLNSITCLATDISATNCLQSWTNNVSSSGTFTKHPSMTSWPTGTSGIPSGWTVVDASI